MNRSPSESFSFSCSTVITSSVCFRGKKMTHAGPAHATDYYVRDLKPTRLVAGAGYLSDGIAGVDSWRDSDRNRDSMAAIEALTSPVLRFKA